MRHLVSCPNSRSQHMPSWCYWDGAFTDDELKKAELYCDALPFEAAQVGDGIVHEQVANPAIRFTDIAFLYGTEESAWIFQRLMNVVQEINGRHYEFDLNGFSYIQYARYDARGQFYNWHVDGSLGSWAHKTDNEPRKLSFTLMLSDPADYDGGAFKINAGKVDEVPMPRGRVVLFPSFALHCVTPVTRGIRKTLTAWVVGPKFK